MNHRPKDVYSVGGGDNMAKEIACYQFAGLIRTVYHNLIDNLICYDEDAQVNSWEKPILMRYILTNNSKCTNTERIKHFIPHCFNYIDIVFCLMLVCTYIHSFIRSLLLISNTLL